MHRARLPFSAAFRTLQLWLVEPITPLSQPDEHRSARLIAALFLLSTLLLIVSRVVRTVTHVPESEFNISTFGINTGILFACYFLSRTRYYRTGIIIGITAVMTIIYIQSLYRAYTNPIHLTDSTVWAAGMILIGGLIVSWQIMLMLAGLFIAALATMPLIVPGLTFYDVRFSLEFIIGMTALITVTTILRRRDLQRIQQQANELSVSETRYRTLLNAGFEAIIIHDNGRILDLNDAVLRMGGYTSPDELIGKMTIDLLTPDARPAIAKLYAERPLDNLVYESTLQHRDGRRVDVEIRSRTIVYQGEMVRVVTMRDVTQAKQASEQINNLFNSLDRVFYSFNAADGRVLQISAASERVYGYPQQVFYDDSSIWSKIIHPEDMPQFLDDFGRVGSEQFDLRPFRIIRKDNEVRWVEMVMIPVFNAAGERTRFDGLVTDITERRLIEAEQRVLQAERDRSRVLRQFITDASHDLRTPLATIYTSLHLLRRVSPPDEKITRYLNTLQTQTTHLARVLEDLFTMSRLDSPETYIERYVLDVDQVLSNALNTHRASAARKGLTLDYSPPEAPLEIMADRDYLLMALNHILNNAIQYTPAGTVTVRAFLAQSDQDQVVIEVADTGIGIAPSEIPLIFDRFYRSDRARQADVGGVGLGLSLARKIVEVHDGTVEVESTPGTGSVFRITLPLVKIRPLTN